MNVKNNKRRQESKEKIKKAFFLLLEKQDLNKVKVSELCRVANINRSTFYANYIDIYDLADRIYLDLKEEIDQLFNVSDDPEKCEAEFLKLFEHINQHRILYTCFFKLGYEGKAFQLQSFVEMKETSGTPFIDYHIAFFKNGFNAIVKMWLYNGCKESPREMCDILLNEYRGRFGK